jgi:hypothetical protein
MTLRASTAGANNMQRIPTMHSARMVVFLPILAFIFSGSFCPANGGALIGKQELQLLVSVKNVGIDASDYSSSVKVTLSLQFEIINTGRRTVLLYNEKPVIGARTLLRNNSDFLFKLATWPSVDESQSWMDKRELIDNSSPPPKLVRSLGPGESWKWDGIEWFYIGTEKHSFEPIRNNESWSIIREASPVLLRVEAMMWPNNIEKPGKERHKRPLGEKLKKQWGRYGDLWLENIISEPASLDLSKN